MAEPESRGYERFVRDLLEQDLSGVSLDAPVDVQHDVKIAGASGHEHQIDVYFKLTIFGTEVQFFVECKKYHRRVGVEDVMTLKSRIDDCGAHKGIIVTTKGFQEGALKLAKTNGIALIVINGLEREDWSPFVDLGPDAAADLLEKLKGRFGSRMRSDVELSLHTGDTPMTARYYSMPKSEWPANKVSITRGSSNVKVGVYDFFNMPNQRVTAYRDDSDSYNWVIDDQLQLPQRQLLKYLAVETIMCGTTAQQWREPERRIRQSLKATRNVAAWLRNTLASIYRSKSAPKQ